MKKEQFAKIISRALPAALLLVLCVHLLARQGGAETTFSAARGGEGTLVIDAGHGGEDGGAVSITGVPESNLNLAVALKLDRLLGLYGVPTKLLRERDISLHDSGSETLRQKKVSDIHNRVATIEATPNATLISIHQNTFSSAKYHGAQVFYANGALSLPLATLTQESLKQVLNPSNGRVPAKIPDSVYLMNHITCPAILVECGFLSNPEEEVRLRTSAYQSKIALALAGAYLQHIQIDPLTEGEQPNEV